MDCLNLLSRWNNSQYTNFSVPFLNMNNLSLLFQNTIFSSEKHPHLFRDFIAKLVISPKTPLIVISGFVFYYFVSLGISEIIKAKQAESQKRIDAAKKLSQEIEARKEINKKKDAASERLLALILQHAKLIQNAALRNERIPKGLSSQEYEAIKQREIKEIEKNISEVRVVLGELE